MCRLTFCNLALAVVFSYGFLVAGLNLCDAQTTLPPQPPAGQEIIPRGQAAGNISPGERSQPVERRVEEEHAPANAASPGSHTLTVGNRFATRVLAMLERRAAVVARVRHRVHLGEYALTGSGRYWQQGVGNLRKTRLELQTQIADQSASLVQVFDGRYLWTDRQFPSGRAVTRLDPIRLQEGLAGGESPIARQGRPTAATSLLSAAASRGSFCGQLADMIKQFDFEDPQQVPMNGVPMIATIGHWKVDELARAWPAHNRARTESTGSQPGEIPVEKSPQEVLADWPQQLPHHVLLVVGPQDMYPYLIEYRRSDDEPLANSSAGLLPANDPLARFEQFDVQFAVQIDNRLFELASGDVQWTDETDRLIKQLKVWEK